MNRKPVSENLNIALYLCKQLSMDELLDLRTHDLREEWVTAVRLEIYGRIESTSTICYN